MKKILIGMSVVSILAFGTLAFAQGMGGWGAGRMTGSNNGGHMMDRGFARHMDGSGYGGHMMDHRSGEHMNGTVYGGHMGVLNGHKSDQTFLNETAELRKAVHEKRFEYAEATRDPNTTIGTIRALEKEINDLESKINGKAPATRGYGASL